MKTFFAITVALLSTMVISATETDNTTQTTSETSLASSVEIPSYWDGWARKYNSPRRVYISVYRMDNQCDSFYAVATKYYSPATLEVEINKELIVKKYSEQSGYLGEYYVTYEGDDYYFKMK